MPERSLVASGLLLGKDAGELEVGDEDMRDDDGLADLMADRVAGTGILETIANGTARLSLWSATEFEAVMS